MIRGKDKTFDTLRTRNKYFLGIEAVFVSSPPQRIQLIGTETVVLVSDGVLELLGPVQRQVVRTLGKDLMNSMTGGDPNLIRQTIASLAAARIKEGQELPDDVTMVAVNVKGLATRISTAPLGRIA